MYRLFGILVTTLVLLGPVRAFEFEPVSFGRIFDAEAERQGNALRAGIGHCDARTPQSCSYTIGDLAVLVRAQEGLKSAGEVSVQSIPLNGTIELTEVEPILVALCSPLSDEAKRKSYLFALQTAYDNDEVALPNVRVILNGTRYLRRKLPDGTGEIFDVADSGSWTEEVRPTQTATAVPAAPPPIPTAADTTTDEPQAATTKEIVAAISPADFKVADPADLHVAPQKFRRKPIEVRHFHCYYADVGDYRCVAPGYEMAVIFTPELEPDAEKDRIENDCGAMKMMMTAKCERTLRFVVDDVDFDQVEMRDRVIFRTKIVIVNPPAFALSARKRH